MRGESRRVRGGQEGQGCEKRKVAEGLEGVKVQGEERKM